MPQRMLEAGPAILRSVSSAPAGRCALLSHPLQRAAWASERMANYMEGATACTSTRCTQEMVCGISQTSWPERLAGKHLVNNAGQQPKHAS